MQSSPIYGTTIFAADCCTVVFLMRLYLREGSPHLLAFGAAYVLSALLVLGHALSFPEAFGRPALIGHDTTSIMIFLSWRIGTSALLLLGIVLGVRAMPLAPSRLRTRGSISCTASR